MVTGLLVLVGLVRADSSHDADCLANRVATLRVFSDHRDRMDLSLGDVGRPVLAVSQSSLATDAPKGRRPSFDRAIPPGTAENLIIELAVRLFAYNPDLQSGLFAAKMQVNLLNDDRATLLIGSQGLRQDRRVRANSDA